MARLRRIVAESRDIDGMVPITPIGSERDSSGREGRPSSWPVRRQRRHAATASFNSNVMVSLGGLSDSVEAMRQQLSSVATVSASLWGSAHTDWRAGQCGWVTAGYAPED